MIEGRQPPAPAWYPDESTVDHANLTAAMERQGFPDYEGFHAWSVSDPDGFWRMVIDDLDIRFDSQPTAFRANADPIDPQWLPGATFNIVASCLDHDAASTAIISGSSEGLTSISVGELRTRVAGFTEGFRRSGYGVGDRVAIVMPMTVEAVVAYLGIIAAGGVVVSIADSFSVHEVRNRLTITSPVAIVTQDRAVRLGKSLPMYEKCVDASTTRCIVVDTGHRVVLRDGDVMWDNFVVSGAEFSPTPRSPSDHTNILFSSGTTGDPKAIPWTQTTPIKAAMDARFHQDVHEGDTVCWPTNLGWMMGPWLIYAALLNGATIALYDDAPTTRGFVEFVQAAGVTMLGVVPSIVSAWREAGVLAPRDWTTLRVLSSTGEASTERDSRWLMNVAGDIPMIEYCGGTEIGGGYVSGTVLQPAVPSWFTTPTLGLDFVLVDEDGEVADQGEVFLVPPSIGLSSELFNGDHSAVYFDGVPAIGRVLRRHGDQMLRVDGGLLRALGRVDDTMNLGGIKVSSAEFESALDGVSGVSEVAAVAVQPPEGGPDRLVVFVVPIGKPDVEQLRGDMQDKIRELINPLFKIHEVVLIESLPRTASHKVMRRLLRSRYTSGG